MTKKIVCLQMYLEGDDNNFKMSAHIYSNVFAYEIMRKSMK